jgi:radical SAM superfamily enzyme YgiQ (UPF0313 family)
MRPDALITECSALTYPAMTAVMQAVEPDEALLAGPFGAANPERARADGWTDILTGEYEYQVADFFGLAHPEGRYVDLDWLPWPDDEDIARIEYEEPFGNPLPGMVQVYPTRGCPLACSFCVVPSYYGGHGKSHRSHRVRDVENVADEIYYLAAKYDGRFNGAYFHEETHNANVGWLVAFAETLIRRGLNRYAYDAMCGYWTFTEDVIALLARAGYRNIRLGIESLSSDVGRRVGKVVFEDKLIRVLEWCKAYGIRTYGTSMVGAPGSTAEKDLATLDALWALKRRGLLDIWQHSVATPQPGTPYYEEVRSKGYLLTDDPARLNGVEAVVDWPDYPAARVAQVKSIYDARGPG